MFRVYILYICLIIYYVDYIFQVSLRYRNCYLNGKFNIAVSGHWSDIIHLQLLLRHFPIYMDIYSAQYRMYPLPPNDKIRIRLVVNPTEEY